MWAPLELKDKRVDLKPCPFCGGGETMFRVNPKMPHLLLLSHRPDSGIHCPATTEQYCDNQEQGGSWWNTRAE